MVEAIFSIISFKKVQRFLKSFVGLSILYLQVRVYHP